MNTIYKRLGSIQSSGVIGTADTLYVASASSNTNTIVSTIVICNTASVSSTYRISINTGTAFTTSGYIVYGSTIAANDSVFLSIGVTLDPVNRYLLCSGSNSSLLFSVFGAESY
jgi:hypothetical protein